MADQDLPSVINVVLVVKLLDHVAAIQNQNTGKSYAHQIKEENDKFMMEKETKMEESNNLAEAELIIAMKEKSRMEHENTMNMMTTHNVEHELKQKEETHEQEMMMHYVIDVSDSAADRNKVLIKDQTHSRFGVLVAKLSNYHLLLFCVFYCFCFFYFCIFPTLL
ncbi:PREDICTED: uncharacterized protein LOC104749437 isoform X1 [Camelina sativa]|uniref:Uncharacterized protein LOC104749437 isoform X1 n=1 Tax=Camelina sativa TaxID=90675 RepID=A0ABM0WD49_CAMSA|nr:PREDICTED: uncharacterized protein LOC104749437 isoform X1 [Camelina sativa]